MSTLSIIPRETATCVHCRLVQFVMPSRLCRRCRKPVAPEEPKALPVAPLVPVAGDFSHIGVNVREIRLRSKITQRQLALRVGAVRTWISKVEGSKVVPSIASLDKLAKALGVTVTTLLGERVTDDTFVSEIAKYAAQLSEIKRTVILNTARHLATQK